MIETTLNLTGDHAFDHFGDRLTFKKSTFPAGEQYIKIHNPHAATSVRINARCNSSDDLMTIFLAINALRLEGFQDIELFIPYFPYARQDRVCSAGESFSLRVITGFFNMLNLKKIITYDVHSNVAGILLDRHQDINNHVPVRQFVQDYISEGRESIALIAPDSGAYKKAEFLFTSYPHLFDSLVVMNKKRNNDGSITVQPIKEYIKGMKAVVVDDICDGGATFLSVGERLREAQAHSAHLFVSHGIFSRGMTALNRLYVNIATTNSFKSRYDQWDSVKVYEIYTKQRGI